MPGTLFMPSPQVQACDRILRQIPVITNEEASGSQRLFVQSEVHCDGAITGWLWLCG